MANLRYEKGRKKENRLVREAYDQGGIGVRSAGSHGQIDVIQIYPKLKKIRLLQSKTYDLPEKELSDLYADNNDLNGTYEVIFEVV